MKLKKLKYAEKLKRKRINAAMNKHRQGTYLPMQGEWERGREMKEDFCNDDKRENILCHFHTERVNLIKVI